MQERNISLALQGGGSHGAFTWGVLDRLLEDGRITFDGISGASAGAMNAVVLADGFTAGGRDGAREALKRFWEGVATTTPFDRAQEPAGSAGALSPGAHAEWAAKTFVLFTRFLSPYQINPFNVNPLRDLLAAQIDFERLRTCCPIRLFVAATQVSSGMLRLFGNEELTVDALLASACLPAVHHAIEIDGEAYWDGGLTANPPIRPLLYKCAASDIVVVLLHPCRRPDVPTQADEISQRLSEISFGASFLTELQGIAMAKNEADGAHDAHGSLERKLQRLNLHVIEAQSLMSELSSLSKLNTHATFIHALCDAGRACADQWLDENYEALGERSTFAFEEHLY